MEPHANRKHRDTLFRDLFGSPERKGNALALYNALAGTDYADPEDLELTTLEDVIYLNVKNDVSFVVGDEMVLFEHQSTVNPNMPLRGLAYFARLYSRNVERRGLSPYGRRRIMLPTPRYVVFYSGAEDVPDSDVMRLSDSFCLDGADLEVTATVLNVNEGRNAAIMGACDALAGYSRFVAKVRALEPQAGLRQAVADAVDECIVEGVLADYFREKKAEVVDMFMTEYDAERQRAFDREEGREQGIEQGRIVALSELVDDNVLTLEQAASRMGVDPETFTEMAAAAKAAVPKVAADE